MKKRFLSIITTLCLLLSFAGFQASAKSAFPDVLSPDHDWASEQIEIMTDLGVIKGYTDGTFKPDKSVNKMEALLLFSRVAGYSLKNYEEARSFSQARYKKVLDNLEIGPYEDFKGELAFLIYKGILSEKEVVKYLEDKEYSKAFPRGDAAILIAGLMDAELKKVDAGSLKFADAKEIPSNALDAVGYVVKEGLMNGVEKKDGSIVFEAEKPLSRAQVCVLLYRIMEKLDMTVESGVIDKVKNDDSVIDFTNSKDEDKSYIIPEDAKIIIDGNEAKLSSVLEKSKLIVVRHGKTIYSIEAFSPEANLSASGIVTAITNEKTYFKLTIQDEETKEEKTFYSNNTDFTVTSNGVADELKSIKIKDFVVVKLLGSKIVSVDRQTTEASVQGVVEKISLSSPMTITVLTSDEITDKEVSSDYIIPDVISVYRDGKKASLRDICIGDSVVLTLSRGKIKKISATSSKSSATGNVTALKIASQSEITISANGKETTYPIALDAKFIVAQKEATIYDLRLGNTVTVNLSGKTAIQIEQTASSSVTTKSGVIETKSSAYGYLNLIMQGNTEEQIFVAKTGSSINAKIISGETGRELSFKDLEKGDYIIATGAYQNGAFVAKTIVVTPKAE